MKEVRCEKYIAQNCLSSFKFKNLPEQQMMRTREAMKSWSLQSVLVKLRKADVPTVTLISKSVGFCVFLV